MVLIPKKRISSLSRAVRKRKRDEDPSRDIQPGSKSIDSNTLSYSSLSTSILHRVNCGKKGHHADHPGIAYYADIPHLFRGDSKASFLRGKRPILNTEMNPDTKDTNSVILYKIYSCDDYHEAIQNQFENLPTPSNPDLTKVAAYFYRLPDDGEEATAMKEEISLISEELQEALSGLTGTKRNDIQALSGEATLIFVCNLFYHYRQPDHPDILALKHEHQWQIRSLQQFIENTYGVDFNEADDLFSRHRVTYSHLAKLFGPEEIVVTGQKHPGQPRAYMLSEVLEISAGSLSLSCWSWNFDGQFWREPTSLTVDWPFSDNEEVPIDELNIYPLRLDRSGIYERLMERGLKFWDCRYGKFISYTNPGSVREAQAIKPRYMIDVVTYRQLHEPEDETHEREYLSAVVTEKERPEDEILLLLPAEIQGFAFQDKKWRRLLVEHISEIDWNLKAFDHLVLKNTKKELIRALIAEHAAAGGEPADVIKGKGNGIILLLHGGPGTGKTLTAESVAELTNRPLYRVTCGDIGTNAEDVEEYLASVFNLGNVWKCVVLLDEADVFLEERTQSDLARNALVSVFLRVLEYYDGILILTSNRIGTFDEAFKSRVQLIVHYPRLKKRRRRQVWENFFTNLKDIDPNARVQELRDRIDDLAHHPLNGREIRNAIRTALLLARFRKQNLGYSHLKEVIGISNEFEQYLQEVHGHDPSEWARARGDRAE